MSVDNDNLARDDAFVFDPATGSFNGSLRKTDESLDPLLDAGEQDDAEDVFFDFDFEDENEAEDVSESQNESEAEDVSESQDESEDLDLDANQDENVDCVDEILKHPDFLKNQVASGVNSTSFSPPMMEAINNKASQMVSFGSTRRGVITNLLASKIAERRTARSLKSFDSKIDNLNSMTGMLKPEGFNPSDPSSISLAEKHFKTDQGIAKAKELSKSYGEVIKSANKILKGHRSNSSEQTSDLLQEQVLKKIAHYVKENEKLLKAMKTSKDSDKTLYDSFSSGLSGLFELAKNLLIKLTVLLGAIDGVRGKKQETNNPNQKANSLDHVVAPPPQSIASPLPSNSHSEAPRMR